jgi:hypothetical protein
MILTTGLPIRRHGPGRPDELGHDVKEMHLIRKNFGSGTRDG